MKFKAKTKDCQLFVRAKTSIGESIDEKELDRFSRVYLRGFLKPRMIKRNLLEYTGPVGISLYERLKKPTTKREFLFILEQIVAAVQKLQAYSMGLNNLVMDLQHVYINEVTKEIQFIYIPTINGLQNLNLIEFIETVAYSVKPADKKDNDFVARFVYFFKAMNPFSINKVESFIAKEDRSVINTIKKQNAGQSGFITDKPLHYYDHYAGKKKSEDDDPTALLVEDDALTGLLTERDDDDATGLLVDDDEATGLLDTDNDDGATGLLSDHDADNEATGLLIENNADVRFPTLFRVLTEETISINKPVFRLGKERSYVDYFVTNNIAVSRSHADIVTHGNKYFIKDLNSKNHTFINNKELPIYMEIEIHDGDRLKLGNEEFIFNVPKERCAYGNQ